jgi:hypothetical protein
MGGHRIDLARNFATVFTVAEAVAIVILLHFGYGLFAMLRSWPLLRLDSYSVVMSVQRGFCRKCV